MKKMDIFCASQASTAICLSTEQPSIQLGGGSSGVGGGGGTGCRAIDRYNPIIKDPRRIKNPDLPISHEKKNIQHRKSSSEVKNKTENKSNDQKRKNITKTYDNNVVSTRKSWSCTKPSAFITPPGSSRYLLSDQPFMEAFSDFDSGSTLVPVDDNKTLAVKTDESSTMTKSPHLSPSQTQVVVLRVSLHCKGCEKKMRKHISRMEGVTSFDIDFFAKKVTVSGDITPLEVLENISKVKNAQLWMPSISSAEIKEARG